MLLIAAVVGERIRSTIEAATWPRHPDHRVTCSIGLVGSMPCGDVPDAQTWVEAADRNLYAAKNSGRNRVAVNEIGNPEPAGRVGADRSADCRKVG